MVMASQVNTYLQTHQVAYVKYVQLFACQSNLNKVVNGKKPHSFQAMSNGYECERVRNIDRQNSSFSYPSSKISVQPS